MLTPALCQRGLLRVSKTGYPNTFLPGFTADKQ